MKTKRLIVFLSFFLSFSLLYAQEIHQVNSQEASKMLQSNKKLVILDVRTPEEFSAGHIKNAINIDIRQADAFSKIDKLNKNGTYLVHCRTYHRSTTAVKHMKEAGFSNIYQIMDGFSGWSQNNLPVVK
jgi:phage shock protein E